MARQLVRSDGRVYGTIVEAAREIRESDGCGKEGTACANISNAARGYIPSAYGYKWKWVDPLGDAYDEALRRIAALESLVRDLAPFVCEDDGIEDIERRMAELGIEVGE